VLVLMPEGTEGGVGLPGSLRIPEELLRLGAFLGAFWRVFPLA
jgi:hypothetical protein